MDDVGACHVRFVDVFGPRGGFGRSVGIEELEGEGFGIGLGTETFLEEGPN